MKKYKKMFKTNFLKQRILKESFLRKLRYRKKEIGRSRIFLELNLKAIYIYIYIYIYISIYRWP